MVQAPPGESVSLALDGRSPSMPADPTRLPELEKKGWNSISEDEAPHHWHCTVPVKLEISLVIPKEIFLE